MKDIAFDHWQRASYGNPDTHYMRGSAKHERTKFLFQMVNRTFSGKTGKIIEFGCNNGRNLLPFYYAGWQVFGYDICYDSLLSAKDAMPSGNFLPMDLFNQSTELKKLEKNAFDVCFSMGFLMHLPESKQKKIIVDNMIRCSKFSIIYEPYRYKKIQRSDPEKKGWHLSEVDYRKYNKTFKILKIDHKDKDNQNMKVWVYNKRGTL